jgi:HSP20 family protein
VDVGDLSQEVRRLFEELGRRHAERRHLISGECMPLQDVFETDRTIEIVLDLPGVSADSCRVLVKSGVVLVVGEKERPEQAHGPASFHLVERDFGRFARAIRLTGAVDATKTQARLKDGELRIVLPKIADRRGREIPVAIESDAPAGG